MKETNYFIHKESSSEYRVSKFLNGEFSQDYRIVKDKKQYVCSCLSGIYRGYCKHKDWISILKKNRKLPDNVEIVRNIDDEEKRQILSSINILGDYNGK